MTTTVVVGAQWGDEGKGKIVDILSEEAEAIFRINGGANAGHSVHVGTDKYVLHLLPVSILRNRKKNFLGPYVACDLEMLAKEMEIAKQQSDSTVSLDPRAPVVLPVHKLIDAGRERSAGSESIGTTGRGIGPTYEDLASRRGVRLAHLKSAEDLRRVLKSGNYYGERMATASLHGGSPDTVEQTVEWCMRFRDIVLPRLRDTVQAAWEFSAAKKSILIEGAQGIMLDVIHGTQPHVTSSFCGAGVVSAALGLHKVDRVIGITKAYATRVGSGVFPTEASGADGDQLRKIGAEFGATTGRPRRCGWLDLPALTYACRVGGITELIVTKLDVLNDFDTIRVCVAYRPAEGLGDERLEYSPTQPNGQPIYVTLEGWKCEIKHFNKISRLPLSARILLDLIEKYTGVPVTGISTGKDRKEMLWHPDRRTAP